MEHLHFLDLPFYQTGTVVKASLSEHDVQVERGGGGRVWVGWGGGVGRGREAGGGYT